MLSQKLLDAMNQHLSNEFAAAHYYLAMGAYCKSEDLDGFANFFLVQAEEERFHAMKFFNFINDVGGRVTISGLENPKNDFNRLDELFTFALSHEQKVTQQINELMALVVQEKNYATISFLNWFVDEQVEEEAMLTSLVTKIKRIGHNHQGIYMLDAELAQRTFTPPANESV